LSVFLDTNVLIYAVVQPEERTKRDQARELLRRADCVLSMQVLNEFAVQSTRSSRKNRLPMDLALEHIKSWRRFPIQETSLDLFYQGIAVLRRHKLSFWDSMIVAAAFAQGCDVLYTEDMQDGRIIDHLRIVNPFKT
jgi:predicted nucleic acid-binding protein